MVLKLFSNQFKFSKEKHIIIILGTLLLFFIWCIVKGNIIGHVEGFKARDDAEKRIDDNNWTFFDKILYGGIGYGNICLPSHLFRVLVTIIFPPLGIVIKYIKVLEDFPWIDVGDLIMNIGELVKSLLLTAFFYIPGLIYSLNQLKCSSANGSCSSN